MYKYVFKYVHIAREVERATQGARGAPRRRRWGRRGKIQHNWSSVCHRQNSAEVCLPLARQDTTWNPLIRVRTFTWCEGQNPVSTVLHVPYSHHWSQMLPGPASERRGNALTGFKDFYPKVKAAIWPWLFDMYHMLSTVPSCAMPVPPLLPKCVEGGSTCARCFGRGRCGSSNKSYQVKPPSVSGAGPRGMYSISHWPLLSF